MTDPLFGQTASPTLRAVRENVAHPPGAFSRHPLSEPAMKSPTERASRDGAFPGAPIGRRSLFMRYGMLVTEVWADEHAHWLKRDLAARHYVYFWSDGMGRKKFYNGIEAMQTDLEAYLICYNAERPHQLRGMTGRTPAEVFVRCLLFGAPVGRGSAAQLVDLA